MRKWAAGLLSSLGCTALADTIYPHYSERQRLGLSD